MIKETKPDEGDNVASSYREKPLSPKHGIASPYPIVLSWNIFLDICIKILERRHIKQL